MLIWIVRSSYREEGESKFELLSINEKTRTHLKFEVFRWMEEQSVICEGMNLRACTVELICPFPRRHEKMEMQIL